MILNGNVTNEIYHILLHLPYKQTEESERIDTYSKCSPTLLRVLLRCLGGHSGNVRLRSVDGREIVVVGTGRDTVLEVKKKVAKQWKVKADDLQISYAGAFAPDHFTLDGIGYREGSELSIIFGPWMEPRPANGVPPVPPALQQRLDEVRLGILAMIIPRAPPIRTDHDIADRRHGGRKE